MFESCPIPVTRYKVGKRGPKAQLAPISKLVNCDRESSLKLDGDSRAFASDIFPYGPLDRLAEHGIVPLRPKVKRG